jgi:hypothetical protein
VAFQPTLCSTVIYTFCASIEQAKHVTNIPAIRPTDLSTTVVALREAYAATVDETIRIAH